MSKNGGDGLGGNWLFHIFLGFYIQFKVQTSQIQEWKESGVFSKIFIIIEACSSVLLWCLSPSLYSLFNFY